MFSLPLPTSVQPHLTTRAGRVTLTLDDSRVRQDCEGLPFNPELVGGGGGFGTATVAAGSKAGKTLLPKLRRLPGTPFCNL